METFFHAKPAKPLSLLKSRLVSDSAWHDWIAPHGRILRQNSILEHKSQKTTEKIICQLSGKLVSLLRTGGTRTSLCCRQTLCLSQAHSCFVRAMEAPWICCCRAALTFCPCRTTVTQQNDQLCGNTCFPDSKRAHLGCVNLGVFFCQALPWYRWIQDLLPRSHSSSIVHICTHVDLPQLWIRMLSSKVSLRWQQRNEETLSTQPPNDCITDESILQTRTGGWSLQGMDLLLRHDSQTRPRNSYALSMLTVSVSEQTLSSTSLSLLQKDACVFLFLAQGRKNEIAKSEQKCPVQNLHLHWNNLAYMDMIPYLQWHFELSALSSSMNLQLQCDVMASACRWQ